MRLFVAAALLLLPASNLFAQDAERIFYVKVTNKNNPLSGQVVELKEFKVETTFGNVTIPLDKIEAVRMRADGQDSAVIALTNGDMITGKIEFDELHLKTNWGKAHIKVESVESFSASPYGRFYADQTSGGWRYSRGSAIQGSQNFGTFSGGGAIQGSGTRIGN